MKTETEQFIINYKARIADILGMESGRHAPDYDAAARWISAQASQRRRDAAKALIDNLHYITHAELIELCKALMHMMYNDHEKSIPAAHQLKWYVGPKKKSAYFIALLCYYFAEQAGYRLPDVIMCMEFDYNDCENSTVFYLDDMSYSGSQMQQLLRSIYIAAARANPAYINKTKPVNMNKIEAVAVDIRIGTCAITGRAQRNLETLFFGYARGVRGRGRQNPYKRYTAKVIPDLKEVLGPQLYIDCSVYFNPLFPPCICYFDHKVADPGSTFTNVLRFGMVPAADIRSSLDYIIGYSEVNRQDYPFMTQKDEQSDKQVAKTEFIPFIKGCDIDDRYRGGLQEMQYYAFMLYSNADTDAKFIEYYKNNEIDISEHLDLYKYKDGVTMRCPKSWYKDDYFSGGTRKRHKSNQNRSRKDRSTAAPWPRKPRGHSRTAARSRA